MRNVYKAFLGAAVFCALAVAGLLLLGKGVSATGPPLIGFFVCLAIGAMGVAALRQLVFTIWIFASCSAAMYYPHYFLAVGDFELKRLIVPFIQIIMFGMGTAMSLKDFAGVVKMPKGVLVGLACQFTIMPFVGLGLAKLFGFPDEIAAGIVLIGSAPSGVASNVMAYIAKADLALSITLTSLATLMAPVMTPLLMKFLAGQYVDVVFLDMMISIIKMVIVPVALGLLFNAMFAGRAKWLNRAMPIVSMIAITMVLAIIVAAGQSSLITVGPALFAAAILHNAGGYLLGYWLCRLVGMDEQSCRTISIEVGLQNGGLASGLASEMGKIATVGLAPVFFSAWMNITGSALANWWRVRPVSGLSDSTQEVA